MCFPFASRSLGQCLVDDYVAGFVCHAAQLALTDWVILCLAAWGGLGRQLLRGRDKAEQACRALHWVGAGQIGYRGSMQLCCDGRNFLVGVAGPGLSSCLITVMWVQSLGHQGLQPIHCYMLTPPSQSHTHLSAGAQPGHHCTGPALTKHGTPRHAYRRPAMTVLVRWSRTFSVSSLSLSLSWAHCPGLHKLLIM